MRKQFVESTGGLGRQALQYVLEVAIRIEPVEHGALRLYRTASVGAQYREVWLLAARHSLMSLRHLP